jgi:hypothetical protein
VDKRTRSSALLLALATPRAGIAPDGSWLACSLRTREDTAIARREPAPVDALRTGMVPDGSTWAASRPRSEGVSDGASLCPFPSTRGGMEPEGSSFGLAPLRRGAVPTCGAAAAAAGGGTEPGGGFSFTAPRVRSVPGGSKGRLARGAGITPDGRAHGPAVGAGPGTAPCGGERRRPRRGGRTPDGRACEPTRPPALTPPQETPPAAPTGYVGASCAGSTSAADAGRGGVAASRSTSASKIGSLPPASSAVRKRYRGPRAATGVMSPGVGAAPRPRPRPERVAPA